MPAYVSFSAGINPQTTQALLAVMADLSNKNTDSVDLMISTPGGNVMNGLNLFNMLRAFPLELTTHNVGKVDSIGNAVFLAGEKRYACPHSTFMFHGVGFDINQKMRLEEKNLQERLADVMNEEGHLRWLQWP